MAKKPTLRTIEEIEACPKTMLTPQDVCGYLHCDPYSINIQCRDDPSVLGFNVIKKGSRVLIPKEAFLTFCRGLNREKATRETA